MWFLLAVFLLPIFLFDLPLKQDEAYHAFADQRCLCCVPNCMDVLSNAGFLGVGIYRSIYGDGLTLFNAGIIATAFGSAYYHWYPTTARLVWDRLPMTVAFSGVFSNSLRISQPEALVAGLLSVIHWHAYEDLGPYVVFQYGGVLATAYHQPGLAVALYICAKLCERFDVLIFSKTNYLISGHTCKHLLAALACATI